MSQSKRVHRLKTEKPPIQGVDVGHSIAMPFGDWSAMPQHVQGNQTQLEKKLDTVVKAHLAYRQTGKCEVIATRGPF